MGETCENMYLFIFQFDTAFFPIDFLVLLFLLLDSYVMASHLQIRRSREERCQLF